MNKANQEKATKGVSDESRTVDEASSNDEKLRRAVPAQISLLYESRDKRFCLFEDADGHLAAVRASRLA